MKKFTITGPRGMIGWLATGAMVGLSALALRAVNEILARHVERLLAAYESPV